MKKKNIGVCAIFTYMKQINMSQKCFYISLKNQIYYSLSLHTTYYSGLVHKET